MQTTKVESYHKDSRCHLSKETHNAYEKTQNSQKTNNNLQNAILKTDQYKLLSEMLKKGTQMLFVM